MFCSKCGKTIPQGSAECVHCGMPISGSDFSAASYIACLPPMDGAQTRGESQSRYPSYTRTTYTTMDEQQEDVFRRTSYRPVYQAPIEPEQEPAEEGQTPAEEQTEDAVEKENVESAAVQSATEPENIEIPEKDFVMEPLQPLKPVVLPGISPQMREHMRISREGAEGRSEPKAPARHHVPALFASTGRAANTRVPKREVFPASRQESAPEQGEYDYHNEDEYAEEPRRRFDISGVTRLFRRRSRADFTDIEEEQPFEEPGDQEYAPGEETEYAPVDDETIVRDDVEEEAPERQPLFAFRNRADRPALGRGAVILRSVIAIVCIVALLAVGFVWLSLRTAARSPMKGVTYSVYEEGISLLKSHATEAYRREMAALYTQDPTGAAALLRQAEDQEALQALLPGTPLANDSDFVKALISIQGNIDVAVTLDALTASTDDQSGSVARWNAINNAIKRLESTNDPTELGSIAQSSVVSATPTPEPTPTVSPYTTLTKGMNDNEDVRAMQNRLYELGWFTDVRDGDFGAFTQEAVKRFQEAVNLTATGIADPETLAIMYSEDAPRTGNRITPAPTEEPVAPANPGT